MSFSHRITCHGKMKNAPKDNPVLTEQHVINS